MIMNLACGETAKRTSLIKRRLKFLVAPLGEKLPYNKQRWWLLTSTGTVIYLDVV